MKKFAQVSLVDFLVDMMPGLKENIENSSSKSKNAKTLFEIWKNGKLKISNRIYRSVGTDNDKLEELQKSGLITIAGNRLHITDKGSDVIKTMILGDDRSSFEDDGKILDYKVASENIKTPSKLKKQGQKHASKWWDRFI